AARGLSLRVRRRNGEHEQTMKAEGRPGVAAQRGEWTWPVTGERPDLAPLGELKLDLPERLVDDLGPVFSTRVHRARRTIKLDGALVEADLDLGQVVAGDL